MAEKPDEGTKSSRRKKKAAEGGMGHNLTEIRKAAEGAFKAIAKLKADQETAMGEFGADFRNLYEKHANNLGCSRKLLRKEFAKYWRDLKERADEAEMEQSERDELDAFQASLIGGPFGTYLESKADRKGAAAE
jgi:hypothetical protein